jgi:acetyl-CoA carboxylase biotin carboxyl carrier protein
MKIDKNLIKELVNYLNEFNLTELEYMDGSKKIKVSKSNKSVISQNVSDNLVSPNKAVLSGTAENNGIRVKSPIIGTAYLAPEPGAKPFIKVGDKVKKGQTIMIVEAMKTMNHIPSSADGTVKKIMVNDGQPVEFGQTLIIIE